MTEEEARAWLADHFSAAAVAQLEVFVALVLRATERQNLISPSTAEHIWSRHVVDSGQLALLASPSAQIWLDVGTGGGFPGMVVAIVHETNFVLSEPRRLRAAFLAECAETLGLSGRVDVRQSKVQQVDAVADVISGRAVSRLPEFLQQAQHCAHERTTWLLPRGRSACEELGTLGRNRALFHVEHSITDPSAGIVVGQGRPQ